MHDDDVCALDSLLMFLYIGSYNVRRWNTTTALRHADEFRLLLIKYHTEVFLLADKYDVPGLRDFASLAAKDAAERLLEPEA